MKETQLKALEFYHSHLSKEFKKSDEIVNTNWFIPLLAVQKKIRNYDYHQSGQTPLNDLKKEEKRLNKLIDKSYKLSKSGAWSTLMTDLEDAEKTLEYFKFSNPSLSISKK